MQTASFTGVIKAIFYVILFYYIFKFVMRLLLPMLLKKAVQKAEENLKQRGQQTHYNTGETINGNPKAARPNETKKVGEYVDFEEIE